MDGNKKYENPAILHEMLRPFKKLSDIIFELRFMENDKERVISDEEKINELVEEAKAHYSKFCFTFKPNISVIDSLVVLLKPEIVIDETELRFDDINLISGRHIVQHGLYHQGSSLILLYHFILPPPTLTILPGT